MISYIYIILHYFFGGETSLKEKMHKITTYIHIYIYICFSLKFATSSTQGLSGWGIGSQRRLDKVRTSIMLEANHDGASVEDNNWGGVGWVGTRLYIVMRCYTCCMAWMIHSFTRMQCTVYLRHIRAWIYDVLFGKGAVYIITLCTHMFQGSTPWTSTWDAVYGYEHHALSKQSYWTTAETQHPDPCFTQLETQVTWKSDWITVEIKVYRPYAYICSESRFW